MKLQLNKLMAGLVLAGGALALVGCGGGGAPDLPKNIDVTVKAGDTTAIATASNLTTALAGVQLPLGTASTAFGVPSNSVLAFTGPVAGANLGGATITSGNLSLVTKVSAGSCVFEVSGPADPALRIVNPATNAAYAIGHKITINPCALTGNIADVPADGVAQPRTITITLGTGGVITTEVQVKRVGNVVSVNDKPVVNVNADGGIVSATGSVS
ncbi:MAG: hypothetical protein Q8S32_06650 [Burkholderiaceae bacterium]|nr:hypothetical protein [Burkholderiaceae bacterium]